MWVKICANTNIDDARLAAALGADAVGFVFAKSARQVTAQQVAEIVRELPSGTETIGVFTLQSAEEIVAMVRTAGLTGVQLHGAFNAEFVRDLAAKLGGELKIIQTVAYPTDAQDSQSADAIFEGELREVLAEPAVWAVLLDAAKSGQSGGLGVAFDWKHVAPIVARATAGKQEMPRIILAGGLRTKNVAQAIAALAPWGVDVASGVEASPGKKDAAKVRAFLEHAKSASAHTKR